MTLKIEVMGAGCARCVQLADNTTEAVAELGLDASVEEVHDVAQIAAAGIMQTPALVIDGQVMLAGRVPSVSQLKELLPARQP
jgi:small redox-active disulfide protein 2